MVETPSGADAWLDRFEPEIRGVLGAAFYDAVRAGANFPTAVIAVVRQRYVDRAHLAEGERKEVYRSAIRALAEDRAGATAFAKAAIAREKLPASERDRLRKEARERGKQSVWANRPASSAQCALLAGLGYREPVANMAEASRIIERLKAQRHR